MSGISPIQPNPLPPAAASPGLRRRPADAAPAGGADAPATPRDGLDRLAPKLAKVVRTLNHFLQKTDTKAAEAFGKAVGKVLRHLEAAQGPQAPDQPEGAPSSPRARRIEFAFEASVTDIDVRLGSGEQLSARQIEVTFHVRFGEALGPTDPVVQDLNGEQPAAEGQPAPLPEPEPESVTEFRLQAFLLQVSFFGSTSGGSSPRSGQAARDGGGFAGQGVSPLSFLA